MNSMYRTTILQVKGTSKDSLRRKKTNKLTLANLSQRIAKGCFWSIKICGMQLNQC